MGTVRPLRTTVRALILPLVALLLLPLSAAAQGSVQGRIVDSATQAPISFALITVTDAGGREIATALTNSDGRYAVAVPAGSYTLSVSAIGYGTQALGTRQVGAAAATADGAIARQALELSPLVVSVGRAPEKALTAPAHVEVVSQEMILSRPTTTPVDHLRSIPGVDVIQQGLQSTNVVVRGFNNIFSGSLHTLTDNRIAGVPSLRVNVMNFVPTTNEDIERIEIVLGPGSALYGPNTSDGVMHMITRSPLASQGSSVNLMAGQQGVLGAAFRTAHRVTPSLGVKLSGQFFTGDEWEYLDTVEGTEFALYTGADSVASRLRLQAAAGIGEAEARTRIGRIAARDYAIDRWSGEARADWAVTENTTAIFTAGMSQATSQIEMTGLGAGQVKDWRYTFYQARLNRGRMFGQIYLNSSDAGETFLLRNGAPIQDKSTLLVAQLQHGATFASRYDFTYGADFIWTNPRTNGSINGAYEFDDETVEVGIYAQGTTEITPTLDLVLAGRLDEHSALPDPVFSPRAALVYEPSPGHALRATVNRAFSTPSSLNQFLDLGTPIPNAGAAALGYSVRVQGTGTDGFSFEQGDGSYLMRSPFTPGGLGGPATLVPAAGAASYWLAAVTAAAAGAAAAGTPMPAPVVAYMQGLAPTPVQITPNYLGPDIDSNGSPNPFDFNDATYPLSVPDIDPIRESTQTTFELGYKGLLSDRFLLAADGWFTRRHGFVTPLTVQTPFITLDGAEIGAYLVPRFMADLGMNLATAQATAAAVAPAIASVPVGVISSADVNANGAQALATYTNVNENIDLFGVDLAATILLTDVWSVSASASYVNDDAFETDRGQIVVLNAPKTKGSLGAAYRDEAMGLDAEVRGRFSGEYGAASGVYAGTVESATLFDLNVSYRLPMVAGTTVQLGVQDILNEEHQSFPGAAPTGRMALLRVRYEF